MSFKEQAQQRLATLVEMSADFKTDWERAFVKNVAAKAWSEGILSLSAKQFAKMEELYDRYCDN